MTQLSRQAFKDKWGGLLPDNTAGEINEERMREFMEDIADSFLNGIDEPPGGLINRTATVIPSATNITVNHLDTKYYVTIPHASDTALDAINNAPEKGTAGVLRFDTGGSVGSPGPDVDVSPSGIIIVGGKYNRERDKNTLNYWFSAGQLFGIFEESSYVKIS